MEGPRQSGQVWLPYRPGSVENFDRIYEATYSRLFATLVALLHDRGAAEDCVQETYLRAFAAWPRWKPGAPIEAWLHRIAINVVVSYRRRERLREVGYVVRRLCLPSDPNPTESEAPEVLRELHALPPKQAAALVLRLSTDTPTVKSHTRLACPGERSRPDSPLRDRGCRSGSAIFDRPDRSPSAFLWTSRRWEPRRSSSTGWSRSSSAQRDRCVDPGRGLHNQPTARSLGLERDGQPAKEESPLLRREQPQALWRPRWHWVVTAVDGATASAGYRSAADAHLAAGLRCRAKDEHRRSASC